MQSDEYNETKSRLDNLVREATKSPEEIAKMSSAERQKYENRLERMRIEHQKILDAYR